MPNLNSRRASFCSQWEIVVFLRSSHPYFKWRIPTSRLWMTLGHEPTRPWQFTTKLLFYFYVSYLYTTLVTFTLFIKATFLCLPDWVVRKPMNRGTFVGSLVGHIIIRSTSESRPNNIEGRNIRTSVRTSVRPQKVSSIWMKFGI